MITRHANDLVDEWIDDGEVEFISRFARPLPQRVMASMLGLPARRTFRSSPSGATPSSCRSCTAPASSTS